MVVPALTDTLVSVSAFDRIGYYHFYGNREVVVYDGDSTIPTSKVMARGFMAENKLYYYYPDEKFDGESVNQVQDIKLRSGATLKAVLHFNKKPDIVDNRRTGGQKPQGSQKPQQRIESDLDTRSLKPRARPVIEPRMTRSMGKETSEKPVMMPTKQKTAVENDGRSKTYRLRQALGLRDDVHPESVEDEEVLPALMGTEEEDDPEIIDSDDEMPDLVESDSDDDESDLVDIDNDGATRAPSNRFRGATGVRQPDYPVKKMNHQLDNMHAMTGLSR
jgi:hypothetical protein